MSSYVIYTSDGFTIYTSDGSVIYVLGDQDICSPINSGPDEGFCVPSGPDDEINMFPPETLTQEYIDDIDGSTE